MLKQSLVSKLTQKLSPQQIQLMKMIHLPVQDFEQRLQQEILENPALETSKTDENKTEEDLNTENVNIDEYLNDDIPSYRLYQNHFNRERKEIPYEGSVSFHQSMIHQLRTFSLDNTQSTIAEFLIGSINDNGYLNMGISNIVDDLAFTQDIFTDELTVEHILTNIIQKLEPSGIGARNLNECLLLQLREKKSTKPIKLAIKILSTSFDEFVKKHYEKLINSIKITQEELKSAIFEIQKLNPKPGGNYEGAKVTTPLIPDFFIKVLDDELELELNAKNIPHLNISREYSDMLKSYQETRVKTKSQKKTVQFIKQRLDAAKWFINAIQERQQTLLLTMHTIAEIQKAYFLSGDENKLEPMILKDVAQKINMDISTVSRVVNNKYCATPYGTKLLKTFFSESIKNDQGDKISTKKIKNILKNFILNEDEKNPLTDNKLTVLLKQEGYPIARRTIAKYREQLLIPVARLRKSI